MLLPDHRCTVSKLTRWTRCKVDGLSYGMGFILWLKEGYADHLEGYSFQEDTLGIDFENVEFELWSPDK
jgi:hypothetical protein